MARHKPNGSVEEVNIDKQSNVTDENLTTSRMVDWSLGLKLNHKETSIIDDAYSKMSDWEQSLNQTVTYVKDVPMFLDVEVKKLNAAVTPEVQLAVWAGALYKKKLHHGWDTSIPMPGVVVNGHEWSLYIFFERKLSKLVSIFIIPPYTAVSAETLRTDDDGPN